MTSAHPVFQKHSPERSCVACRRKRPQGEFIRLTRTEHGWALVDGTRTGRGAYVCADSPDCWQVKRLGRAFRGQAAAVAVGLMEWAARATPHPLRGSPP